ncbi:HNH endonuclease [Pseudomonas sp.]|uniref:HNH endonuclease n=1 Tax=Pseudomonas sp. TaxID=306 RepID=UPI0029152DD7|nr:HNH endonuclease [Pseudomonas sp.]MDU4249043.1 HNH endonuclease [Pseudomonas sp.]
MSARENIRKSVRFEVFKRDNFTCQYCGAKAPDVVLHVDHINPVSKGGDNEIINLVTACLPCNLGKSDRLLSDSSALDRQRAQLEDLNERREQLEMMLAWRDELQSFNEDTVQLIADRIGARLPGHSVNEHGKSIVRKWIKKFTVEEILDALDIAAEKLSTSPDNEEVNDCFEAIPRICVTRRLPEVKQRILYARGILRRRIYVNESQVMALMNKAVEAGLDVEELIEYAKQVRNWTEFRSEMEEIANG